MNKTNSTLIWDKVATSFSKSGNDYWNRFGEKLVSFSDIKLNSKILDIGFGRGASLFPAIRKVGVNGKVIGIDISNEMIKETYKDIKNNKFNNVELINMNINNLIFPNNYFDNVLCGFSIEVNENNLNEIFRILKNNGKLNISIWGIQLNQQWLNAIVNKYLHVQNNIKKVANYNDLLNSVGFTSIEIIECLEKVVYKTKDDWWNEMNSNAFRNIIDAVSNLGFEKFHSFKSDIYDALENFYDDDNLVFEMPVIYISAKKY